MNKNAEHFAIYAAIFHNLSSVIRCKCTGTYCHYSLRKIIFVFFSFNNNINDYLFGKFDGLWKVADKSYHYNSIQFIQVKFLKLLSKISKISFSHLEFIVENKSKSVFCWIFLFDAYRVLWVALHKFWRNFWWQFCLFSRWLTRIMEIMSKSKRHLSQVFCLFYCQIN